MKEWTARINFEVPEDEEFAKKAIRIACRNTGRVLVEEILGENQNGD